MVKFIKGNEAVIVGALYAGCRAYFGYPITPASEVAHAAAAWFPLAGRSFVQAECETASAYMVFGAGSTGIPAMTATSGPGMSLMQEALSYLACAEVPGVFVNVMRTGPGLGNVYPEQADYNQSVKSGGHGNYHALVLAPGSVQEMCDLTIEAFRLAFKYRTPAIVLADGLLGQMMEALTLPEIELELPDTKAWAVQGDAATRPNVVTSIFTAGQEPQNIKLQAKYEAMQADAAVELDECADAEIILLAYGSVGRLARTAKDALRAAGKKVGLFRPKTLFPFPREALAAIAGKKLIVAELSNGQFRDDVQLQLAKLGHAPLIGFVNHMGGTVLTVDEIIRAATL
ncbi:MAG: 3-methyl-2-oxobutanoate dehydrogenase subunit VorB [Kiritimatiellia bacterium]